jgi:hypothetical protein
LPISLDKTFGSKVHLIDRPSVCASKKEGHEMPNIRTYFAASAIVVLITSSLEASEQTRTTAILTTMTEAALATSALLRDQVSIREVGWSAKYTDRNFTFSAKGQSDVGPIEFTISGEMKGEDGSDFVVNYGGSGTKGKDPIQINGKMEWRYDKAAADYIAMDFNQQSKFGANSLWGWVVGAEIGFGAVIGAGGAIAAVVVSTGGIGGLLAIPIGIAGAGTGATGFIGASSAVKNLVQSEKPTAEPPAPNRPARPRGGEKVEPSKETIVTVVADNGQLTGNAFGNVLLVGKAESGSATGSLTSE